jgi:hypothetical protein
MTDSRNALKVFYFDGRAETTSYSAARQEMKLAHMNTIAGRLNGELLMNYGEYYRSIQDRTLKEVSRSKLESVMRDFGGLSVEEVSYGKKGKGFSLLYVNLEPRDSPTLTFDGEFFTLEPLAARIRIKEMADGERQNGFFETLLESAASARDEIEAIRSAIPKGQPVYIGDCGYYVRCLSPVIVILHSQADIDTLAEIAETGLSGEIRGNGLPARKYVLDIRDFKEAVTSNPGNEEVIAKLGFTERNPSIPFVPNLETADEEFYAVGDRVFLDNDLKCQILAIGNERVWYLNMSEMPCGVRIPDEKKAAVTVEWLRSFEIQFFGNLRNLELVRRRKHREIWDIIAEMNRDRNFMGKEKRVRRTDKSRGKR